MRRRAAGEGQGRGEGQARDEGCGTRDGGLGTGDEGRGRGDGGRAAKQAGGDDEKRMLNLEGSTADLTEQVESLLVVDLDERGLDVHLSPKTVRPLDQSNPRRLLSDVPTHLAEHVDGRAVSRTLVPAISPIFS